MFQKRPCDGCAYLTAPKIVIRALLFDLDAKGNFRIVNRGVADHPTDMCVTIGVRDFDLRRSRFECRRDEGNVTFADFAHAVFKNIAVRR